MIFRDWLRSNPADRVLYERTKRELDGRYWDLNDDTDTKTAVIEAILQQARSSRPRRD